VILVILDWGSVPKSTVLLDLGSVPERSWMTVGIEVWRRLNPLWSTNVVILVPTIRVTSCIGFVRLETSEVGTSGWVPLTVMLITRQCKEARQFHK
jgi:hypothetical protein